MQVSGIDSSSYALYSPYDISADESLVINDNNNFNNTLNEEGGIQPVNGTEPTATAVAINPIPQESIEFQELQQNIISTFDNLKNGEISKDEFASSLEEFGIVNNQNQSEEQNQREIDTPPVEGEQNQNILDLASAFIENVRTNSPNNNEDNELSQYASLFDKINEETQSPEVNEQLQAYTQNLRY